MPRACGSAALAGPASPTPRPATQTDAIANRVKNTTSPSLCTDVSPVTAGSKYCIDQQVDAHTAAGVDAARVYSDKLSGTSTREHRPGLAALLDYAREGDAIVVVGIDRLGRNAAEVMTTIRELGQSQLWVVDSPGGLDKLFRAGDGLKGLDRITEQPHRW